jgi:hypothetical protein
MYVFSNGSWIGAIYTVLHRVCYILAHVMIMLCYHETTSYMLKCYVPVHIMMKLQAIILCAGTMSTTVQNFSLNYILMSLNHIL